MSALLMALSAQDALARNDRQTDPPQWYVSNPPPTGSRPTCTRRRVKSSRCQQSKTNAKRHRLI